MFVNIFLFDDFDTLDAFGPAEVFGSVQEHFYIRYISMNGGIVNSSQGVKVWTEPLNPDEIEDILILTGGRGVRSFVRLEEKNLPLLKKAVQEADLCLMTENASAILASSGLLFQRQVADYDYDENWKRMFTVGITHVPNVRWLMDGKFYSCSSAMASLDMALGVIADTVDIDVALHVAEKIGCEWDPESEGVN